MIEMHTLAPLLAGIFVASLAGSVHCAGMCGAMATVSCAGCPRARQSVSAMSSYHFARGLAYAGAGALAGGIGGVVNLGGGLLGVQRLAGVVAGLAVVLGGIALLMRHGGFAAHARAPKCVERWLATGHRTALGVAPLPRAAIIGALSVLLPCGWLWAFLAVAAGMGSAAGGALAMIAFWAGSVPILSAVGLGAGRLSHLARGRVGALMGAAMVAIGLHTAWMAAGRSEAVASMARSSRTEAVQPASMKPSTTSASSTSFPSSTVSKGCESDAAVGGAHDPLEVARARVRSAASEVPPCCREDTKP